MQHQHPARVWFAICMTKGMTIMTDRSELHQSIRLLLAWAHLDWQATDGLTP